MKGKIIREQEPKEMKKLIAMLLQRLAKLYQIPNWTEENAILLTEWIHINYQYEEIDCIVNILTNPPNTGNKNWRLTPDTVQEWMSVELDKQAEKREKDWQNLKQKELAPPESTDKPINWEEVFKGSWFEKYQNEIYQKDKDWNEYRKSFYNQNKQTNES